MKYICECINSLFFDVNCVKCGCSNTYGNLYIDSFDGKNFDINKINTERMKIVECFRSGIVPERCRDCYMLQEDLTGEIDKELPKELDHIFISNWLHCNCGCIYCSNRIKTKLKISPKNKKSDFYDLLPSVKKLCAEGYIGENTKITTIGGEPTVLNEFDKIMSVLLKYSKGHIIMLSNGIKFSKTIYNILKKGNAELIISIDSGTPEMYRRIKRVDQFKNVINNIKKYIKANPKNKNSVYLKYIMIRGLNDNWTELNNCLNVAREIGINKLYLDVDYNKKNLNAPVPEHWYQLFDKFLSTPDLETYMHDYCKQILEKQHIF